jgi:hypothetical protein
MKNTFIIWEPHTKTHADTVPGWAKYFLDMGYRVIAVVGSNRINNGLFMYSHENLKVIRLPQPLARLWLRNKKFSDAAGILVTSAEQLKRGKAKNQKPGYDEAYAWFRRAPREKIFLVFHEIKKEVDAGHSTAGILTLDKMDYKGAETIAVNPHCLGEIPKHEKNRITSFITIGTLRGKRRNSRLLLESVQKLHDAGIRNFKITAVGKGVRRFKVPAHLQGYFDLHNALNFKGMYEKIADADFFLSLMDADTSDNDRYITTGTSGNFQLMYGFAKPPVIAEKFAEKKSFDAGNAMVYKRNADLVDAMKRAIRMSAKEYGSMRDALGATAAGIYKKSLIKLREFIKSRDLPLPGGTGK